MNHTSHQRMDEELRKFIKRVYPEKTMVEATHQLAEDLWADLIYGRRIKTKFKKKLKE